MRLKHQMKKNILEDAPVIRRNSKMSVRHNNVRLEFLVLDCQPFMQVKDVVSITNLSLGFGNFWNYGSGGAS
jgi:hypothetical protein